MVLASAAPSAYPHDTATRTRRPEAQEAKSAA